MNNTFDLNRLGKVIRRDGMNYIPNMGLTMAILLSIPVMWWLLKAATPGGNASTPYMRLVLMNILKIIAIIVVPARLYKDCNDSRKGIGYAMLPASTLEKFISMFFYCMIVTPIIYIAGSLVIDSLLTIIPCNNPFSGFVTSVYFSDISTNLHPDYNELIGTHSYAMYYLYKIVTIILIGSIFMLGNMVFKKRKTQKMIGILMLLAIVFMFGVIAWGRGHVQILETLTEEEFKEWATKTIHFLYYAIFVSEIVISAVLLWFTYYKIKTQKY
jgi:hypothetical protein